MDLEMIRDVFSPVFIGNCPMPRLRPLSNCEGLLWPKGPMTHSRLLAVTVRTDTKPPLWWLCRSGLEGCVTPVLCGICGLPLKRCKCRVGEDY